MNEFKFMYEFDSVIDRHTGENKNVVGSRYTNPVDIIMLMVGRSAIFQYVDANAGFNTSTVESILIHSNSINIVTRNTEYWLKPRIRREVIR